MHTLIEYRFTYGNSSLRYAFTEPTESAARAKAEEFRLALESILQLPTTATQIRYGFTNKCSSSCESYRRRLEELARDKAKKEAHGGKQNLLQPSYR